MNHRLLLLAVAAVAVPTQILAQGSAARDNIDALIEQQAKAQGVPASFVHAVVKRESNYNPKAKGGSALGLMQIKPATARGMGYQGDAAGLFDPGVNLRYGIAYLAGAYKAAKGDIARAYGYYNRGYYYAAKRLGIETEVAELDTAPKSSAAFGSVFARSADPSVTAANTALAYAPSPAANAVPTEFVDVPLPPRRPSFLTNAPAPVEVAAAAAIPAPGNAMLMASADIVTPAAIDVPLPPRRPVFLTAAAPTTAQSPVEVATAGTMPAPAASATPAGAQANAILGAASEAAAVQSIDVPLPPRRPSPLLLASVGRPIVAKKPIVAGTVMEASALPPVQ
jgi:hypothetical protein